MGKILLGIIIMSGGLSLILKTEWFLENFGYIAWFERKFGSEGGSRLGYKLIGLGITLIGIIVLTGSGPAFMNWLVAPLIRYN